MITGNKSIGYACSFIDARKSTHSNSILHKGAIQIQCNKRGHSNPLVHLQTGLLQIFDLTTECMLSRLFCESALIFMEILSFAKCFFYL